MNRQGAILVTDFDGTLSSIVLDPDQAKLVPGAIDVLADATVKLAKVVIISGRRAKWLAETIGLESVDYHGLYGAERRLKGDDTQVEGADRIASSASRLARDAQSAIVSLGLTGCWVEFKELAVSVHFRENPQAASPLLEWAKSAATRKKFHASLGRAVVELRPQGISKASTAARVLDEYLPASAIVAGDDAADAEMMRTFKDGLGRAATCIGVLSDETPEGLKTIADVSVPSPEHLIDYLRTHLEK